MSKESTQSAITLNLISKKKEEIVINTNNDKSEKNEKNEC